MSEWKFPGNNWDCLQSITVIQNVVFIICGAKSTIAMPPYLSHNNGTCTTLKMQWTDTICLRINFYF